MERQKYRKNAKLNIETKLTHGNKYLLQFVFYLLVLEKHPLPVLRISIKIETHFGCFDVHLKLEFLFEFVM